MATADEPHDRRSRTRIPALRSDQAALTSERRSYTPTTLIAMKVSLASRIVLVEGLTEEHSLPIYAEAMEGCQFDSNGISVVECGSASASMDRVFVIFNEPHIPCYMLFDYDCGNVDKSIIEKSKGLLILAGEAMDALSTPESPL